MVTLEDRISFMYKEEVYFALIQVSKMKRYTYYISAFAEHALQPEDELFHGLRKSSHVEKKDRAIAIALREEGNKAFA